VAALEKAEEEVKASLAVLHAEEEAYHGKDINRRSTIASLRVAY